MVEITYQMVLSTLQTVGLLVGIYYYIMTLNNTRQNRRITLTTTVLQPFMTEEGQIKIRELIAMEWSSLDDFKSKYDHLVNPENAAKRLALWNRCETIGILYRDGLLDLKILYGGSRGQISMIWFKFKPVIEMYRETDMDARAYEDFEYLAERLLEYTKARGGFSLSARAARAHNK